MDKGIFSNENGAKLGRKYKELFAFFQGTNT